MRRRWFVHTARDGGARNSGVAPAAASQRAASFDSGSVMLRIRRVNTRCWCETSSNLAAHRTVGSADPGCGGVVNV
jgi:hypothetical protein